MGLPELIEILPLQKQDYAEVTVPGSKSITNRALILSALSDGEVVLNGALWSDDTRVLIECLQKLGFNIEVKEDPSEKCNRTITIKGKGGLVPAGGSESSPLELYIGNAGTAARFLTAFLVLGDGVYKLYGAERMHERPQSGLFNALRHLGYHIESDNNKLPALIYGSGKRHGKCVVDVSESSQFASALLMCAEIAGWEVEIKGPNPEEVPYVKMTKELISVFPKNGGKFSVEADASSGSYFIAAGVLKKIEKLCKSGISTFNNDLQSSNSACFYDLSVKVANWPKSGWQIDQAFYDIYRSFATTMVGGGVIEEKDIVAKLGDNWREDKTVVDKEPLVFSRKYHLGDSIMTLITLSPFATLPVKFVDLDSLRLQECERVLALKTELTKCGARVFEIGNSLTIFPSRLNGAEIETYNDHRMAMCFSILGLRVAGIKIRNPSCVKKTFPTFYQKLVQMPPFGLGAKILDGITAQEISYNNLYAD